MSEKELEDKTNNHNMKNYTNGIKAHEWHIFCQDWIERRDKKMYSAPLCEYGRHIEFYNRWGQNTIHLRAEEISSGTLFEIRLLCADRNDVNYKIVALVDVNGKDLVQEFNCDGESKDGLMKLHYEVCYFDQGDYVITKQGMVGIFANGSYVFAGVQGDQEYPYQCSCDTILRLANEEERALLDKMLTSKKKRWNQEKMELEDANYRII